MEKMDHKVWFVWGCAFSMALGAGGMYLTNRDKIEFCKKYPLILETKEFMDETAEMPLPDDVKGVDQVNSYLALYGDKYTYAHEVDIKSAEFVKNQVNNSPTALGMGYTVEFDGSGIAYFSEVLPDMPAAEQGIEAGDRILAVNDQPILDFVDVKKLNGKDGTTADLTLLRGTEQVKVSITRVLDSSASAGVKTEKYGDTLYVDYRAVGTMTGEAFSEAIRAEEFDSVIFDLRGNPGGEIGVAVSAADMFINAAPVYLHSYAEDDFVYSTTDGVEFDVPIVVLVNDETASSAEIMTALLKQYADTTIVGTTTFGKGIYQSYASFKGYSLQYTAGYVTVGNWDCYDGKGISPDIIVSMDKKFIGTDNDIQLQKALELIG